MNERIKLVLWGWGFEAGRYFCGGALERRVPVWMNKLFSITTVPAVPVTWQWYFGVHWRWLRPKGCGGGRIWWFSRNFYFGKPHNPTPKQEARYRAKICCLQNLFRMLEGEMYTPRQLHAAAKLLQHALRYVEDRGLGKAENPTVSYYNLGVYGICPVYISAADILERLMNDVQDLANAKGGIVSHNTADVLFEEAIDGQS